MSDILVTGALGRLGRWVVDHLVSTGRTIAAVDVDHPGFGNPAREGIDFRAVDLTDLGETREVVESVAPDHIVHLAAIPNPEFHAGSHVFENNVMSAYNVLVSAGRGEIPIVWASSESAYGFPFADDPRLPDYLPIDEDHPMRPEDPYGTSKVLGEDVAAMVTRKYGVPVASLRVSNVQYPGRYGVVAHQDDIEAGVGNFWSYVDGRDVATAIKCAIETDLAGHEPFVVAADDSYLGRPTRDVVEEVFGRLPDECDVDGESSALSNAKARDVLGWAPAHDWREAKDEAVHMPSLIVE